MALGIAGDAASLPGRVLAMLKAGAASALVALSVSAMTHAGAARITDGKALLRAMHDRYQHDWYATLTFEQTSTTHNPDGTLTRFHMASSRPLVHMLLVLGFDVYRQPVRRTIAQVAGQGFDLTKLHEDTWEGVPVYVVGADAGDLKTKQFWIERKRLLFVRLIDPGEPGQGKIADTRFLDYRRASPGWVFSERYSAIRVNPALDPAIFDPRQFTQRHWEK